MKLIHDDLGFGKTRVLMLDDQVSVREMAAAMVTSEGLCAVVGQASSGVEGLRMFRKLRPGAVILALALPEMSGAEVLLAMREENPRLPVLVYSGTKSQDLWRAGLRAGPQGVVHKTESMATLREGVTAVVSGQTFFGRFATAKMEEMRLGGAAEDGLAPRLRTVLQMIAEGLSTKQVASRLSLSPKTVEHYRTKLMQKIGVKDVASLTRYALRCGLVD